MSDFRSLSLKQLRALAETLRHGTVTAAAKALHVTPPAITTQLKLLEKSTGSPVCERTSDGFIATEVGRELLNVSIDIEKRLIRARERIEALQSGAAGSVVLGVVSTGKYVVPNIVAAFRKAFPDIRVTLSVGNRGAIIEGIDRDEFDLVIMGRPPAHIEVERAVLADHPHLLIAPPGHRLSDDADILAEDLLRERFLAREPGSGTRMLMDRFFERIGSGRTFDVVEMGTNETIKQAVMADLGLAIISAHTCHAELNDGRLVALPYTGFPVMRHWFLIHDAQRPLTSAASILKTFIIECRQALFPRLDRSKSRAPLG